MNLETDLTIMSRIIAAHPSYSVTGSSRGPVMVCTGDTCGLHVYEESRADWVPAEFYAAHLAFELIKAGIGPIPKGLGIEYGSRMMTLNGPSGVQSDGPVPNVSWYSPSTHRRWVTLWEDL